MIIRTRGKGSKFFCLHCFKTFKAPGSCCEWPLYRISYKARPPKKSAKKSEWKTFFDLFLDGHEASRGQLKRIISIRKEYGLNTLEHEKLYEELEERHEKSFKFLDIKRHEPVLRISDGDEDDEEIRYINKFVREYREKYSPKIFNLNKKYFMVPIHGIYGYGINGYGYSAMFPKSIEKYNVLKVAVSFDTSDNTYKFRIMTNNINELYSQSNSVTWFNTKYSVRQGFLIFDTREKAMAFRYKYLVQIIPLFKEHDDFFKHFKKVADSDSNRVMRKAPELLI